MSLTDNEELMEKITPLLSLTCNPEFITEIIPFIISHKDFFLKFNGVINDENIKIVEKMLTEEGIIEMLINKGIFGKNMMNGGKYKKSKSLRKKKYLKKTLKSKKMKGGNDTAYVIYTVAFIVFLCATFAYTEISRIPHRRQDNLEGTY
jgi:hypothetical protein